jgi:hypothetical protein
LPIAEEKAGTDARITVEAGETLLVDQLLQTNLGTAFVAIDDRLAGSAGRRGLAIPLRGRIHEL